MNKDIALKWVTALESGEYSQGRSFLHQEDDSFCCLGVLCDLYQKEHSKTSSWHLRPELSIYAFDTKTDSSQSLVPKEVQIWAGLDARLPSIKFPADRYGKTCITDLNDGKLYSFAQIAQVIREAEEL